MNKSKIVGFKGLSGIVPLRDYFAKDFAVALMNSTNISHHEEYIQSVCKQAYVWADAMMKAREQ